MSDAELIARLRYGETFPSDASGKVMTNDTLDAAASRIEALTARLAAAEGLAEALRTLHANVVEAFSALAGLEPVANAAAELAKWEQANGQRD